MRLDNMQVPQPSGGGKQRILVLFTMALLWGLVAAPGFAKTPQTTQTMDSATVQAQVKKFGVGKSVKMTLVSGEQVSGHLRSIGADSFTVKVSKSAERTIPYDQVTFIKDPGPLMWMLIGAAIVIIIIVVVR